VSDIHLNPQAFDLMDQVTKQFSIDAIVDTGDIVDWGTKPENRLLGRIGDLHVPYVYVRGNHDSRATQRAVAAQPNAVVLDGDAAAVAGLRVWGIGDPRYTPNKNQSVPGASERDRADAFAPVVAEELAAAQPPPVDVVLVHDQRTARAIGGDVPLVLAGHTHRQREGRIEARDGPGGDDRGDAATTTPSAAVGSDGNGDRSGSSDGGGAEPKDTILLVEGSTGGAGLRGLQGDEPKPLQASVLYFDRRSHQLLAYDSIAVEGLGETGATIQRHILVEDRGSSSNSDGAG
jgi:predicted phosphodiesterase